MKAGKKVPEKFLYSTIYVKSIIELYNCKKFDRVIEIIRNIQDNTTFAFLDKEVQKVIQFYYCSSLARKRMPEFESNVTYFKDNKLYQEYNFLKGFNYRLRGQYNFAEQSYLRVLMISPSMTRRAGNWS